MGKRGGTKMYCPSCKKLTICKAISVSLVTFDSGDRCQNRYFIDHDDVNFFQRGRECLLCGFEFVTYEVDSSIIDEIILFRGLRGLVNSDEYREALQKTSELISNIKDRMDKS